MTMTGVRTVPTWYITLLESVRFHVLYSRENLQRIRHYRGINMREEVAAEHYVIPYTHRRLYIFHTAVESWYIKLKKTMRPKSTQNLSL